MHSSTFLNTGFDRDVRLALRFPVSGGLMNQHYSQIVGFAIGLRLPADTIIMPCGYSRQRYSQDPAAQVRAERIAPSCTQPTGLHPLCP